MQQSASTSRLMKSGPTGYCGSFTDDDSGIGVDLDYTSSSDVYSTSDVYSSTQTLLELPSLTVPPAFAPASVPVSAPAPLSTKPQVQFTPLYKWSTDGIVERIRPATMSNSRNGDFVVCRTKRGTYVAYRTPIVPQWVTQLVHEIELRQT